MQPLSLSTKHDRAIHFVINFVVGLLPPLIEPYNPQIFGLQFFKCARNIRNLRHGQMLAGAGGRLRNRAGDARGAPLWNQDAIGAASVGGSQDRAEIVQILNPIEDDDQRVLSPLGGDHIIHVRIMLGRSHRDDALVCTG